MKNILILLLVLVSYAFSQEQKPKSNEPFEIPNAIIYGDATLNVASGVKSLPNKMNPLSQKELDSINNLDKQQSALIPKQQLSNAIYSRNVSNNIINGSFGRFTTAELNGSFAFDLSDYKLNIIAGLDYSDGHLTNANYAKANLLALSEYIAPDKFWIFGGSKTRTKLKVDFNNYNNFANIEKVSLSSNRFEFDINTIGKTNGFDFSTFLKVRNTAFDAYTLNRNELNLQGKLEFLNPFGDYEIKGAINLELNSFATKSANLIEAIGGFAWTKDKIKLNSEIGIQLAGGTNGQNYFAPKILLSSDYKLNKNYTLQAEIRSGLRQNYFTNFLELNPYINSLDLIPTYDLISIKPNLIFHPNTNLAISVFAKLNLSNNLPIYLADTLQSFKIIYSNGLEYQFGTDATYHASKNDRLLISAVFAGSSLDTNSAQITYLPMLNLAIGYNRVITDELTAGISLRYVSERRANLTNSDLVPSFIDLRFNSQYQVNERLGLFLNLDNILNQDIILWQGIRERFLFARLGINWIF